MTGNIGEWVDSQSGDPLSVGGAMSTRGAECSRRSFRKPPASRNRSTGFRCCSDTAIESDVDVALLENEESVLYQPAPVVEAADVDGNPVTLDYDGQVTLVNFFASWCGPCRKEFPYLVDYVDRYSGTDLQIVGIGLDTNVTQSINFAEQFGANFLVLTDPESQTGGQFLVYTMPATFLVDRQGVVRYQFLGFAGAEQEVELRNAIEDLL
jgi:peroxiredoxin